jgi:hypothetical protein
MPSHSTESFDNSKQANPKNYEVGYKRPPVKSRFQPGKSGNPSGRRRKHPSPEEYLSSLMARQVTVNENGISKKITRTEALMHKLFGAAIKGDIRAAESIIKILSKQAAKEAIEGKPVNLEILTREELEWLDKLSKKCAESKMNEEIAQIKRKYGMKVT